MYFNWRQLYKCDTFKYTLPHVHPMSRVLFIAPTSNSSNDPPVRHHQASCVPLLTCECAQDWRNNLWFLGFDVDFCKSGALALVKRHRWRNNGRLEASAWSQMKIKEKVLTLVEQHAPIVCFCSTSLIVMGQSNVIISSMKFAIRTVALLPAYQSAGHAGVITKNMEHLQPMPTPSLVRVWQQ